MIQSRHAFLNLGHGFFQKMVIGALYEPGLGLPGRAFSPKVNFPKGGVRQEILLRSPQKYRILSVHSHRFSVTAQLNETVFCYPEEAKYAVRACSPELKGSGRSLWDETNPADMLGKLCLHLGNRSMKPPAPLDHDHGRVGGRVNHEVTGTVLHSPA
jgi:hypothetical protein